MRSRPSRLSVRLLCLFLALSLSPELLLAEGSTGSSVPAASSAPSSASSSTSSSSGGTSSTGSGGSSATASGAAAASTGGVAAVPNQVNTAATSSFTAQSMGKSALITAGWKTVKDVSEGKEVDESVKETRDLLISPEFIFGSLVCGRLGKIAAACIPVPGAGGVAAKIVAQIPMMFGFKAGAKVGSQSVTNVRNGKGLDLKGAMDSVDWTRTGAEAVGGTIGMVLGGFLPLGPVGPIIGNLIGSEIGGWLCDKIREHLKEKGPQVAEGAERLVEDFRADPAGTTQEIGADAMQCLVGPTGAGLLCPAMGVAQAVAMRGDGASD